MFWSSLLLGRRRLFGWLLLGFLVCPPAVIMAFLDVPRADRIIFAVAGMFVSLLAFTTIVGRAFDLGREAGRRELEHTLRAPAPRLEPPVLNTEPDYVGPVPVDPVREGTPARTPGLS